MKSVNIKFNFSDDQYEQVTEEAKSINMEPGEMLTKTMQFIVKEMLDSRKNIIYNNDN